MKKKLLSLALATALAVPTAIPVYAAQSTVKVNLPNFTVTLNGTVIDNSYSKYPLIVYNDITYFPMTYYDCRFLGLETDWQDSKSGLFIDTTGIQGAYNPYTQSQKNAKNSTAQIAAFPITVNGQAIDNAKEQYPLLIYRDVTYFPMTWRFCVDEFNWEYSFDNQTGLTITSANKAITKNLTLPKQTTDNDLKNIVATDGEYVYYVGENNDKIMCAIIDSSAKQYTDVFNLPTNYASDLPVWPSLYNEDGRVMLTYHIGGATMGSTCHYILNPNGATELPSNNRTMTNGTQIKFFNGAMSGSGNLSIKKDNDEWVELGSPGYAYGLNYFVNEQGEGYGTTTSYCWRGNKLYIPAFNLTLAYEKAADNDYSEATGIYCVDITNGETTRITPEGVHVSYFTSDANTIFYTMDNIIYRYDIDSGTTDHLAVAPGSGYEITDFGPVYSNDHINSNVFISANNGTENQLYLATHNSKIQIILDAVGYSDFTVKNDHAIVTFAETPDNPYRILVIDNIGRVVFKSADTTSLTSTYIDGSYVTGYTFYYFNQANNHLCQAELD